MTFRTLRKFIQTTDGTTTTMFDFAGDFSNGGCTIYLFAERPATADQNIWAFHAGLSDAADLNSGNLHTKAGDATTWTASVSLSLGNGVRLQVTGATSQTVNWTALVQGYF